MMQPLASWQAPASRVGVLSRSSPFAVSRIRHGLCRAVHGGGNKGAMHECTKDQTQPTAKAQVPQRQGSPGGSGLAHTTHSVKTGPASLFCGLTTVAQRCQAESGSAPGGPGPGANTSQSVELRSGQCLCAECSNSQDGYIRLRRSQPRRKKGQQVGSDKKDRQAHLAPILSLTIAPAFATAPSPTDIYEERAINMRRLSSARDKLFRSSSRTSSQSKKSESSRGLSSSTSGPSSYRKTSPQMAKQSTRLLTTSSRAKQLQRRPPARLHTCVSTRTRARISIAALACTRARTCTCTRARACRCLRRRLRWRPLRQLGQFRHHLAHRRFWIHGRQPLERGARCPEIHRRDCHNVRRGRHRHVLFEPQV